MRVADAIARVDNQYPNQYSNDEKVNWLSILDAQIHSDVIETHEYISAEGEVIKPPPFIPYDPENMSVMMTVPFPYDDLYVTYLKMKIDEMNEETDRYNNHAVLFNNAYQNFAKHYNKTHRPLRAYMHYVGAMSKEEQNERVPDVIPRPQE